MSSYTIRKEVDTRDELLVNIQDVIACIKEREDALRRTIRHVFTRVATCVDVDVGIFEHLLQTVPTLSLNVLAPELFFFQFWHILYIKCE